MNMSCSHTPEYFKNHQQYASQISNAIIVEIVYRVLKISYMSNVVSATQQDVLPAITKNYLS